MKLVHLLCSSHQPILKGLMVDVLFGTISRVPMPYFLSFLCTLYPRNAADNTYLQMIKVLRAVSKMIRNQIDNDTFLWQLMLVHASNNCDTCVYESLYVYKKLSNNGNNKKLLKCEYDLRYYQGILSAQWNSYFACRYMIRTVKCNEILNTKELLDTFLEYEGLSMMVVSKYKKSRHCHTPTALNMLQKVAPWTAITPSLVKHMSTYTEPVNTVKDEAFRLLIDLYLCSVDNANGEYDENPADNIQIIKFLQNNDNLQLFYTKIVCSNTILPTLEIVSEERLVLACVYKLPPMNKKGKKKFDQVIRISAMVTANKHTIKALNNIFLSG